MIGLFETKIEQFEGEEKVSSDFHDHDIDVLQQWKFA